MFQAGHLENNVYIIKNIILNDRFKRLNWLSLIDLRVNYSCISNFKVTFICFAAAFSGCILIYFAYIHSETELTNIFQNIDFALLKVPSSSAIAQGQSEFNPFWIISS